MNMKQCENGHFYNPINEECPHCQVQTNFEKTVGQNFSRPNQNKKPFPLPDKLGNVNVPKSNVNEPLPVINDNKPILNTNGGETIGLIYKKVGIDPVVGWLVCVEGKDRGKDYRIHSGRNSLGRLESNDIAIKGDNTISRESHAFIVYDPKKQQFRILAGEGRTIVYLNDEAVDFYKILNAYDIIEIGETKLLFVPFCGEKFQW